MKRIILSLSVLLMLAQNGFAKSDAWFDQRISNAKMKINKYIFTCDKLAMNHKYSSSPNICNKALNILHKKYPNEKKNTAAVYFNAGIIYYYSKKDYLKTYEYWMKSAKLGDIDAQKSLDIFCRDHSWVCK